MGRARMLPGGLRAKLFLSYAGIIVLCLGLAGSAFVYLLRPYQTRQELNRLSDLVVPLGFQVRFMEVQGAGAPDITTFLDDQARALNVRILLVRRNDQSVVHDTAGTLESTVLAYSGRDAPPRDEVVQGTVDVPDEGSFVIVSFSGVPGRPLLQNAPQPRRSGPEVLGQYQVALAAPSGTVASAWLQIAPPLRTAGLIAIVASFIAALFIARGILRPITQVTRASEAMARGDYNQQIEVRGGDEIAQLASSFNVMAEQVARSNRTLRDFLADVSHELRTPLTTIEGFAEAILDGTAHDDAQIRESARIISEDAHRMHRMVEDLLYLSKVESGQLSMDVETVDLLETVDRSARRAKALDDGQRVEVHPSERPLMVRADARRIEQVLDNLLVNALQHTPEAGAITIGATATDGEARVRVHNTGSYISPEERESIFQRFYRGSNDGKGAGLGLAIASEIARAHGGEIMVDSSPGDGTAFTLVLPLSSSGQRVNAGAAA